MPSLTIDLEHVQDQNFQRIEEKVLSFFRKQMSDLSSFFKGFPGFPEFSRIFPYYLHTKRLRLLKLGSLVENENNRGKLSR